MALNVALAEDGFLRPREERLQLEELLKQERSLLIDMIKSGKDSEKHRKRFVEVDEQVTQLERINACEFDVARFSLEYFSDDLNSENDENLIPSGVNKETMSGFHKELNGMLSDISAGKKRNHIAWACPRSHAKTAYGSNIYPLHSAVFQHRQFIVVVSETVTMAGAFILWGNRQLKFNRKLIEDFGMLMNERPSNNETDNREEYVTLNGVKIMARGAGGQMRGMRYGSTRPQLIILDDLEGDENVSTKDQMQKTRNWFNEDALPALDKDGMCLYLGTILCYDSLLDLVIRKDGRFESRRYKAIKTFAKNKSIWDEWKDIYVSDDAEASSKARDFYETNKDVMLDGVELLWPEYWSYYEFMELLVNMGTKSFTQEYQNEPTDEERQIFKVEEFIYYDSDAQFDFDRFEFYAGVDFAMGKEKGDYSSIVTLAKNKTTDVCYVVDVFNQRLHPKEFIEIILDKVRMYQYENIAVEAQMAQEFFADTLSEKLLDIGYPAHLRVVPVKQRTRKELRIEAMSPDLHNGKLRFKREQTDLIGQYETYPMAQHDDMIDATEMAYSIATKMINGEIESLGSYYDGMKTKGDRKEIKAERIRRYSSTFQRRRRWS